VTSDEYARGVRAGTAAVEQRAQVLELYLDRERKWSRYLALWIWILVWVCVALLGALLFASWRCR
jgi:hypothetical protein